MATVSLLRIHPVKGLPPTDVTEARVLPSGALEFDRRWALMDARGRFVNGKNFPDIHRVGARFDLAAAQVTIDSRTFGLQQEGAAIAAACGRILGEPLTWAEDADVGFPDDLASPGPTFVAVPSVAAVAGWFGFALEDARCRFAPTSRSTAWRRSGRTRCTAARCASVRWKWRRSTRAPVASCPRAMPRAARRRRDSRSGSRSCARRTCPRASRPRSSTTTTASR